MFWTLWRREKSLTPFRNQILAIQHAACHYADGTIPAPLLGGDAEIFMKK
jgi:hypothetical protein